MSTAGHGDLPKGPLQRGEYLDNQNKGDLRTLPQIDYDRKDTRDEKNPIETDATGGDRVGIDKSRKERVIASQDDRGSLQLLDSNHSPENWDVDNEEKQCLLGFRKYYYETRRNIEKEPEQLTGKEREVVKEIERLPIFNDNKVALILVWRRLKPGTNIQIDVDKPNFFSEWNLQRKAERIKIIK